ncbi:hypothetical protein AB4Y80_16335 [Specibacter sp. RAF43]
MSDECAQLFESMKHGVRQLQSAERLTVTAELAGLNWSIERESWCGRTDSLEFRCGAPSCPEPSVQQPVGQLLWGDVTVPLE